MGDASWTIVTTMFEERPSLPLASRRPGGGGRPLAFYDSFTQFRC